MDLLSRAALNGAAGGGESGWDITSLTFNGTPKNYLIVDGRESYNPMGVSGLRFKPDGMRLYIPADNAAGIYQFDLTTAFDIRTATFDVEEYVGSQDQDPNGIFFKPDGTKMYISGKRNDQVREYDLTVAWDIDNKTLVNSFSVGTQTALPYGLFFKPDGTKFYIIDTSNIYEYTIPSADAWDISQATYNTSFSFSALSGAAYEFWFKNDGSLLYVATSARRIYAYTFSSGNEWDISQATYSSSLSSSSGALDPVHQGAYMWGLEFDSTGDTVFLGNYEGAMNVARLSLSTSYDLSSVSSWVKPSTDWFNVNGQDQPEGLFFKPDGTKMYVCGGRYVREYSLSTPWELSSASYVDRLDVYAQERFPSGVYIRESDGLKLYVVGTHSDQVEEYDLDPAWDISTATHVQSYAHTSVGDASDIYFHPDGDRMYILAYSGQRLYYYTLTSDWDISTASEVGYEYTSYVGQAGGMFFHPDGLRFYQISSGNVKLYQQDLTTAWDPRAGTASPDEEVDLYGLVSQPRGLYFKEDGSKVFISDFTQECIWSFDLT